MDGGVGCEEDQEMAGCFGLCWVNIGEFACECDPGKMEGMVQWTFLIPMVATINGRSALKLLVTTTETRHCTNCIVQNGLPQCTLCIEMSAIQ